jgi:hypothetical protein
MTVRDPQQKFIFLRARNENYGQLRLAAVIDLPGKASHVAFAHHTPEDDLAE